MAKLSTINISPEVFTDINYVLKLVKVSLTWAFSSTINMKMMRAYRGGSRTAATS